MFNMNSFSIIRYLHDVLRQRGCEGHILFIDPSCIASSTYHDDDRAQAIANRILSNFDKWKGTTLSMAGRLALINSVIYSSFLHSFMVYRWPSQLLKHMEKCIRNFLWTGDITSKKSVTVKWN